MNELVEEAFAMITRHSTSAQTRAEPVCGPVAGHRSRRQPFTESRHAGDVRSRL